MEPKKANENIKAKKKIVRTIEVKKEIIRKHEKGVSVSDLALQFSLANFLSLFHLFSIVFIYFC